jgi:hypothetical protein
VSRLCIFVLSGNLLSARIELSLITFAEHASGRLMKQSMLLLLGITFEARLYAQYRMLPIEYFAG